MFLPADVDQRCSCLFVLVDLVTVWGEEKVSNVAFAKDFVGDTLLVHGYEVVFVVKDLRN